MQRSAAERTASVLKQMTFDLHGAASAIRAAVRDQQRITGKGAIMAQRYGTLSFLLILVVLSLVGGAFQLPTLAHAQTLVNPAYTYGTYVGGHSDDRFYAVTTDSQGNIYLAGSTYSTDFPGTRGKQNSSEDMVIVSLNPSGTTLRWATVLGGSDTDQAKAIAVDKNGHLWLTGLTGSADFPITAAGAAFAGYYDVVIAELDGATGALRYSNLVGGESADQGTALVIAPDDTLYITGQISDDAGFRDVLALAFDTQNHTLRNAIKFGRERGEDMGNALALDGAGNVYITGKTEPQGQDTDFPLVQPFQAQCGIGDTFGDCGEDAFITSLDPALTTIRYSTYLGGSFNNSNMGAGDDAGTGIAVGADGSLYVTGYTFATDFPVVNAVQATKQGADNFPDAFVARLNPTTNQLLFATYLGGEDWEEGHALRLDGDGNVLIGGMTDAKDFPVRNAPQPTLGNGVCNLGGAERYCYDGFVAQFSPDGSLNWSTYVGGGLDDNVLALTVASNNQVLVVGGSESSNFPVSANAYQGSKRLEQDGFLSQLGSAAPTPSPTATQPPSATTTPPSTATPVGNATALPSPTPVVATPTPPGDIQVLLPLVSR